MEPNRRDISCKWRARVAVAASVGMAMAPGFAQAQDVGVFVSSPHDGNFGGLAGADVICQAEGSTQFPEFAGPWKAWLSDSNTSASVRVAQPGVGGAYVRASDGATVIANDLAALTNTSGVDLAHAIDPEFWVVWTGTGANGLKLGAFGGSTPAEFCDDWTSSAPAAADTGLPRAWIGNSNQVSMVWTENGLGECVFGVPLYCMGAKDANADDCQAAASALERGQLESGTAVVFKNRDSGQWLRGEYVGYEPGGYDNPHDVKYTDVAGNIFRKDVYEGEIEPLCMAGAKGIQVANSAQPLPTEREKIIADTPTFPQDITCGAQSTITPNASTISDPNDQARIITMHNDARGTNPSVVWDDRLARYAQGWADALVEFNAQGITIPQNHPHSQGTCYYRKYGKHPENISGGSAELEQAVQLWLDEKEFLAPATGGVTCQAGKECGHYLQVVYYKVLRVGCGHNSMTSWICAYDTYGAIQKGAGIYLSPWK